MVGDQGLGAPRRFLSWLSGRKGKLRALLFPFFPWFPVTEPPAEAQEPSELAPHPHADSGR